MFRIAKDNAFPDVKVESPWSLQLFRTRTSPWLAGLRREALETYVRMNKAVAT